MTDCPRHKRCAYSGTEPGLCPICHASNAKCGGEHGMAPAGGWETGVAGLTNGTLKRGQYKDPRKALQVKVGALPAPEPPSMSVSREALTTSQNTPERIPA